MTSDLQGSGAASGAVLLWLMVTKAGLVRTDSGVRVHHRFEIGVCVLYPLVVDQHVYNSGCKRQTFVFLSFHFCEEHSPPLDEDNEKEFTGTSRRYERVAVQPGVIHY
ncbi:unnamed protein product [Trichobilharzia regenti]|nr:unnamed protein product [Trichobilharzia regenti]